MLRCGSVGGQDNKIVGYKVQMFQVQRSICKLVGMNPIVVKSKDVMKTGSKHSVQS